MTFFWLLFKMHYVAHVFVSSQLRGTKLNFFDLILDIIRSNSPKNPDSSRDAVAATLQPSRIRLQKKNSEYTN